MYITFRVPNIISLTFLHREKEGGNQLNVGINKHHTQVFTVPDVLESYKNVCSCVNVPEYVQNMDKWSIDNHHKDFLAYYE